VLAWEDTQLVRLIDKGQRTVYNYNLGAKRAFKSIKSSINIDHKALFARLEGRVKNDFEKKEEISGRNREVWERKSLKGYFFFITQNPLI
jgi:hypothetical protein